MEILCKKFRWRYGVRDTVENMAEKIWGKATQREMYDVGNTPKNMQGLRNTVKKISAGHTAGNLSRVGGIGGTVIETFKKTF